MKQFKKSTKLFMIVLMTLVLSSSCSKDDIKILTGTVWESVEDDETFTLTFNTSSTFTVIYVDKSFDDTEKTEGTYTYEDPKVTFKSKEEPDAVGTINGNTLTVNDLVFMKK